MTDGTSNTSYTYHLVNSMTFGAGNLASIDGPLANDTIALMSMPRTAWTPCGHVAFAPVQNAYKPSAFFTYDTLGRPKSRSINGSANTTTVNAYDALGRVTQLTNPLGTFTHNYDPVKLLPKTITAPNGLSTTFDYETAAADLRLKEIKHQLAATNLAAHAYGYKKAGNIKSWSQTAGSTPAKTWSISYDKADQLEAATQTQNGAVIGQQAFRFDKSGNITSKQNGAEISQSTFNNRNQLTAQQPGGFLRVRGVTDESANVKVKSNNNPFTDAQANIEKEFAAWVPTTPGQNTITIEAKDDSPNANTKTQSYTVNITGQSRTPTYDLNGNTTANGTGQTYQWDAEDRLIKITYADNSSTEFSYDGLSRRVRITEKNASNALTSDKRYLWAGGNQPAEERDAAGTTVLKQYHPQGEFIPAAAAPLNKLFYAKDHLGSMRELVDGNGTLQTRYDYDMWGKRVKLSGTPESDVGYTGHHHHAKSGLVLTWFRAYDAEAGRWLSADPLGEEGGLNLYGFVGNEPISGIDYLGLKAWMLCNRCEGTKGPMRCIVYDSKNNRMRGDPFTTNQDENTRATPSGKHGVNPKPDSQMDPANRGLGNQNVENGRVSGPGGVPEYPAGTPSLTGPGMPAGKPGPGWKPTVRIHGRGRSDACITTDRCGDIQRVMEDNLNDGGMTVEISDVCCKNGEGPPDPIPRAIPVN